MNFTMILFLILIIIIFWFVNTYNKFIKLREMVKNSMGQISAQVESRWDAISSIIDATKQYSSHEADVLKDITNKRSGISNISDVEDVEKDTQLFEEALKRVSIVVENYPDLKASGVFENAMNKIDDYEKSVRSSRMIYNDTVTKYNRSVLVFPASIVAKMFNFKEMDYFKSTETKADMPSWN